VSWLVPDSSDAVGVLLYVLLQASAAIVLLCVPRQARAECDEGGKAGGGG
jgi:hypothetical protein